MNLNFWPFKKKPSAPKPRIMRFERRSSLAGGDWCCGVELTRLQYGADKWGMSCVIPMGQGHTPQDAYADWKRQREAA